MKPKQILSGKYLILKDPLNVASIYNKIYDTEKLFEVMVAMLNGEEEKLEHELIVSVN